jgi:hypothetical protein
MGTSGTTMGQSDTSMPNALYDLVSTLYHTLKSGSTTQQHIHDAQQAGDNDLTQFYQQMDQEDRRRAERCQQLLGQRLQNQPAAH